MRALVLVDLQNDFLPTGALPVPKGDEVLPIAAALVPKFDVVVATQDWHPKDHGSFATQHPGRKPGELIDLNGLTQVLWPDHCVQGTKGAEFAPGIEIGRISKVFPKGTDRTVDSYSGFFDNGHRKATGLGEWLKAKGVDEVVVLGLATDYCVKFTALDARGLGLKTTLVVDACRGVNLQPDDSEKAIAAMRDAGVKIAKSSEI